MNNLPKSYIVNPPNAINTYVSKPGRNLNSGLGGNVNSINVNFNNMNTANVIASPTNVLSQGATSNVVISENKIKKLNLDKLQSTANNKNDMYRFITSSVDNRDREKTEKHIFDLGVSKQINKNMSLSPNKIQHEDRPEINNPGQNPTKSFEITNTVLSEMINSLNKKNENKSRNAQRNNLTNTKSNLFSSDKTQTVQSGSYQKNLMLTQVINKMNNVKSGSPNLNNKVISKAKGIQSGLKKNTVTTITNRKVSNVTKNSVVNNNVSSLNVKSSVASNGNGTNSNATNNNNNFTISNSQNRKEPIGLLSPQKDPETLPLQNSNLTRNNFLNNNIYTKTIKSKIYF